MDTTNRNETPAAASLAAARQLADAGCDWEMDGCWSIDGVRLASDSREALSLLRQRQAAA